MAKITAITDRTWSALGTVAMPMSPGALNFGLAGIFAAIAGVAWYCAQAGIQRLPQLAR